MCLNKIDYSHFENLWRSCSFSVSPYEWKMSTFKNLFQLILYVIIIYIYIQIICKHLYIVRINCHSFSLHSSFIKNSHVSFLLSLFIPDEFICINPKFFLFTKMHQRNQECQTHRRCITCFPSTRLRVDVVKGMLIFLLSGWQKTCQILPQTSIISLFFTQLIYRTYLYKVSM